MAKNLTHKILEAHLVDGRLVPGEEIGVRIDHALLQDATGTMAMLGFEALGIDSVRTELAAQYVDHNIIQTDNKNADDHRYLQTASASLRPLFQSSGKRRLAPGAHGAFRSAGKDHDRGRQPHTRGDRCLDAGHRRGRFGRRPWRWRVFRTTFRVRRCSV